MIVLQFYNLEKNIDLVFDNIIQLMIHFAWNLQGKNI